MKQIIPAAFALSLVLGGIAHAQTTTQGTTGTGTGVGGNSGAVLNPGTSTTGTTGGTGATATPGTTGTTPTTGSTATTGSTTGGVSTSPAPAAVTTTAAPSRTTEAPVAGANSFTEGQARARIEERGFGQVTDLKKDDKGIWRATAMKDGKSVSVALDYQGNIVSQ